MNRFVLAALAAVLLASDSASAGDQTPTTDDTPFRPSCDGRTCTCDERWVESCGDMVWEKCQPLDENWKNDEIADRIRSGDHPPNSWLDCDSNTGSCSCPEKREVRRRDHRTERVGSGETAANGGKTAGGRHTASFDEADALFGRRTEVVVAKRGTPTKELAKEEGDQQEPKMGAVHSDAAPPISGDRSGEGAVRETEVDHRRKAAEAERRRDETTKAPQDALAAPSDLTLSDVGSTSLTLSWQDNATSEFGVYVERGTPTDERGGTNYHWQQVFSVEERVMSQVEGTGRRSDMDDGLRSGQRYCYRLRAYRGQGESNSDYSEIACATTR